MRSRSLPRALAFLACAFLSACASGEGAKRVETFRVDAARRAFTLEVDAPGEPLLRYAGDESGRALEVSVGGKPLPAAEAGARRGDLVALLERAIARVADLAEASGDAAWMRRFRDVYSRAATAPGAGTGAGTRGGRIK